MKKIINGKKYDTKTAKEIFTGTNGKFPNDCFYAEETLYKKRTGEFFLYNVGDRIYSDFVQRWSELVHGETSRIHDGFMPVSESEAKEWAEEAMSGDSYEETFGEVGE